MEFLNEKEAIMLMDEAEKAASNTYSPYSGFAVGSAVLTTDGQIFKGTNIENASYSLTICAERIAMGNTIANGHMNIKAIAVFSPNNDASPCGSCRQFILEFGGEIVVIFKDKGEIVQTTISQLVPFGFDKTKLV